MNFTKFSPLLILALIFSLVGCTTYVPVQQGQAVPQYEYNPGYNPDNAIADAILMSAVINGVNGYYGPGHIFYPSAMYGGVSGYYVGGVFHTSVQNRTVIVNHYNTGRSDFQRNPTQFAQQHPDVVKTTTAAKPNFGSQQGGMTKSAPTATAPAATARPNFGSQQGGMTKSAATPQPAARPSFGSQSGGMTRASSPAPSRPSSSSGASRRK